METALYVFLENMQAFILDNFWVVGLEILGQGFQKPFRCITYVGDRVSFQRNDCFLVE